MKNQKFTKIAMIAAIYAVVTIALAPLSFGPIQVRIAESLTLLPLIYPPAIWGVTLGCAISNLVGAMVGTNLLGYVDVFVGTLATFLAALATYNLRNVKIFNTPIWAILMPVLFNAVIIGAELAFVLTPETFWQSYPLFASEVGVGELLACVIIGIPLINALKGTGLFKE